MGLTNKKDVKHATVLGAAKKTLHKYLDFTAREQYKLLRANLNFVLPAENNCHVIGVTSSIRGEGKSTTSINLAYVLAQAGHQVLLVDGDLRLPSLGKKLEMTNSIGLTDLLIGKGAKISEFQSNLLKNLFVVLSGAIPPNPSELLGSRRMETVLTELKNSFDYIIVDLPPVNIVSDAMSVSHLLDGIIVVLREEYTKKKDIDACFRQLELANAKILGCVTTRSSRTSGAYGKYKKYKYYGKYGRYGRYGRHVQDEQLVRFTDVVMEND